MDLPILCVKVAYSNAEIWMFPKLIRANPMANKLAKDIVRIPKASMVNLYNKCRAILLHFQQLFVRSVPYRQQTLRQWTNIWVSQSNHSLLLILGVKFWIALWTRY